MIVVHRCICYNISVCPHRLEAQDNSLSRCQQGFEFPWGYQITLSSIPKVPPIKLKARAPKNEQLSGTLSGYLAAHAAEGLPQRPIAKRTIYRYMGALLAYEKALQGVSPSP